MDKTGVCSSRNTVRTDLSLLLECLKFQMKSPDLQKQALLTIQSICEKRDDNVDLLREMGGVAFIYNLSKSTVVHLDVKETALFTLGTLAEANEFLCRKQTFADLAGCLMKDEIPLAQKRVSVYLLSVLVANNKSGQTLAQTTGCLDILLDLFRTSYPISTDAKVRVANATQTHYLWTSVSSALCACVNNPQNEEAQRICVAAFPMIKIWLQQIVVLSKEILQPICSFIALTVANNACVQESFSTMGGLETLSLVLVRLSSAAATSLQSCQLSVTISKTLTACIGDNRALASGLAQYGIVSHLISLLANPNLDTEDRLSVLLSLVHCTEATEEHQSHFVQCGGLPLIITLLTEDTSEEVRKVATFILQTCKQATLSLGESGLMTKHGEGENAENLTKMERFRSSARELLHRLNQLEKRQVNDKHEAKPEQQDTNTTTSPEGLGQPSQHPVINLHPQSVKSIPTAYRKTHALDHGEAGGDININPQTVRSMTTTENGSELKNMSSSAQAEKAKPSKGDVLCSVCQGTGFQLSSHVWSLEGRGESHNTADRQFKSPAPVRHSIPKEIKSIHTKSRSYKLKDCKVSAVEERHIRCAGCVLPFEEITSRTFSSLQSSCFQSCDMHKILQEATERYRTHHCNLLVRRANQDYNVEMSMPDSDKQSPQRHKEFLNEICMTSIHKEPLRGKSSLTEHYWKKHNGITLTPLHKGVKKDTRTSYSKTSICLTFPQQHIIYCCLVYTICHFC
ncbi:hypothetical protein Q5P01_012373 [Channa striata]|uniref:Telomere repeats-binding bouquet formation protein 1 n=1 Tax=Channa striata TaxID=64152 RepID=A0AA88MTQ5_CHASR|nr:hypothetical protein Q5P01_012373 [Channa striata]